MPLKTTDSEDFYITDSEIRNDDYNYQQILTPKLDNYDNDFTQEIINEIVLWKVNRYVTIHNETLLLLNKINKADRILNEDLTKEILISMLTKQKQKGIRLPMASTILRFKNPFIYQITDQRVYRYITNGNSLPAYTTNVNEQIKIYLDYLNRLQIICDKHNIPFEYSDRILYTMDKNHNKAEKLK